MAFHVTDVTQSLRVVHEIVKRAPKNCPSRAVAVGASALLVVASAVMSRFAISRPEDVWALQERHICAECSIRHQCKYRRN